MLQKSLSPYGVTGQSELVFHALNASDSQHRQTTNISYTLVGNEIIDHSDVLEHHLSVLLQHVFWASSVGAAATTSSFST